MTKSGWWHIKWEITLDGEEVRFDDLSESSQEHIANLIKEGYHSGEIIEETEDEEERGDIDEDIQLL